ncbi:hypothetical protein RND81_04G021900 [Saponaria officinalis]|uniref:Uncharacterized protein n=1 Tax=Saponaria officinalis TaxID=3572 RepID=A0AAW1LCJ6_SAPOF
MASVCDNFLEAFAYTHVSDDFLEDGLDGWNMMNFTQLEGSPLIKVKSLKEQGNEFFKQKQFDAAASCYDEACKIFSLAIGVMDDYDTKNLSDLAISLNLNLAACALKLFEYEAANDLCSLVLTSFPHNVNALFRRALASLKLNMLLDAQLDLEKALLVEPKNKDILRELSVVKNKLLVNSNGKGSMVAPSKEEMIKEGKRTMPNSVKLVEESLHLAGTSGSGSSAQDKVSSNSDGSQVQSADCPYSKMDVNFVKGQDNVANKMFYFTKKGEALSQLRISTQTYQQLLEGKIVSFHQKFQSSVMTIRILKPTGIEESLSNPSKKKRRRKSKKAKSKLQVTEEKDIVNPTTTPTQASVVLDKHQPFIFSSPRKIKKFLSS